MKRHSSFFKTKQLVFGLLLFPMTAFAAPWVTTLTVTPPTQVAVAWGLYNVINCRISSTMSEFTSTMNTTGFVGQAGNDSYSLQIYHNGMLGSNTNMNWVQRDFVIQDFPQSSNGNSYTFTTTCSGASSGTQQTAYVTVEATTPPVASISVTPSSAVSGSNFTFTWSGTNNPSEYFISFNSGAEGSLSTAVTWTGNPLTLSGPIVGANTVYVKACNAAGCSPRASATFTITNPPSVNLNFSILDSVKTFLTSFFVKNTENPLAVVSTETHPQK